MKLIQYDQWGNPCPTPEYHRIFDSYPYPREWQIYVNAILQPTCKRYCDTALKCPLACLIDEQEVPF